MDSHSEVDLQKYSFRIEGLSAIDKASLSRIVNSEDLKFETASHADTAQGELATLAIAIGIGLVPTVVAYLFGKKKRERVVLESSTLLPDGTWKTVRLVIEKRSDEPADTSIVSQIVKQLQAAL